MRLFDFTVVKLCLCLIVGILIERYVSFNSISLFVVSGILLIALLIFYTRSKKQFLQQPWFGISGYLLFILIGITSAHINNPLHYQNHYTSFLKNDKQTVELSIQKVLKPTTNSDRYEAIIHEIDSASSSGKILLVVERDSTGNKLKVDNTILAKSILRPIAKATNPHQFDYAAYLANQYIYHQLYLKSAQYIQLENKQNTLSGRAAKTRNYMILKLKENGFKDDVLAVISTLLLGDRLQLSNEIREDYVNAGAVHILAISGLHIGIIYFLLQLVFGGFKRQQYRLTRTILIISCLWVFAFIAGMSASVVRAVSMFTAVAIAVNLNRITNTSNILFISMFFLLLFKPTFLFEVGFQLSYLAVFAIIWTQPLISKLWNPKAWFLKKFWDLTTVTISAQLGVLPLSLFYFHQFPGLFFLSNLIIIPLLGLIIGFGILICVLATLNILPSFAAKLYSSIINSLNNYVGWIADKEAFIFKDISFSLEQMLACYIIIIASYHLFKKPNSRKLLFTLSSVVLFQSSYMFKKTTTSSENELIIFDRYDDNIIGIKKGKTLHLYALKDSITNTIRDYKIGERIEEIHFQKPLHFIKVEDQGILTITKETKQLPVDLKTDILILHDSPTKNIDRLIRDLQPKTIVVTSSNYPSFVKRWKNSAEKKEVGFYSVKENGAFRMSF
ncbi:ComEC/Rec2 family competence protein [Spongiivirga citrea]|uniref:DUF4131 domain-containing protein n=1 Tax=Spongiivirga citrea TaxID=1481457 RepID=A0A6M0CRR1_9FLAO|nr:ComEC/Rec2 family competence protein [Spongiivirga citrea]NER18217.1 DUF4131 domain-containing protein [Spongiivirga citrea]